MRTEHHGRGLAWLRWAMALACTVAFTPGSVAADATNRVSRYGVRIWQAEDGLPQNSVFSIAQTRDGYLWVGTHDGLVRFDGVRFVGLDEKVAPELKHGWITALCATGDGSLWIACDGSGLFQMKGGNITHFTEAEGLPSNATRCLFESSDGSIWIGTEGGGLSQFKAGKFTTYGAQNGLAESVRAICEDQQGSIRVATMRGLSSLNRDGLVSTINFGIGTVANALKSVCEDDQTNIWVTSNEGVTCVKKTEQVFYGVNEGLPDRIATVVYEDRAGRVWVGTYSGLACLVDGKVVAKPMNEAGFGDLVYAIFEDREENIWVGARDGLYRVRPARFTTYSTQEGLSCNNAMSICEDQAGTMWVGTWGGGLNQLVDDKITVYGSTNGLTHDKVLSLYQADDNTLWVGMDQGGGLNHLGPQHQNIFPRPTLLGGSDIRAIHEDRKGTLWVGSRQGLYALRNGKVSSYTTAKGLAGNMNLVIFEDSFGKIWIGTDGGLSRWEGEMFKSFTTRDGLSHNVVGALYEDRDHALWIGTRGGGLNRYKEGKFTVCTTRQGLFNDEVYEILEDGFGYFWMSCRNGIFRVSLKDLNDLCDGTIKRVTCTAFGKADGMVSVQCNGVAKPSGWKSRDGRLWFPTIRGVVAVESRIKTNEQPPPVAIEEVIVDRKPQHPASKLSEPSSGGARTNRPGALAADEGTFRIPPGRGELEIGYTALSFQASEKNRFKYMLEGVDPEWIDAGTRRTAYYNNLGPGNYRFRVKACNNDGTWNEAGATLALVFLPHFWQTWWFKLAVPAVFGLFLWAWYHARVSRLREIERLRVQIAADLHDDVGSRLTKVAMVTEFVEREAAPNDPSKPHIQNIARTTREVIQAMDEIVWTINPRNDTLDNLANYLFQYAQEYFQNTGVRCRLDLPARLQDYPLSTEQRHNLFMAVKEALNNVLKHANATEVRLGLAVTDGKLAIIVTDNGRGFVKNGDPASGNGLNNMKQRLQKIGGRMELETKPGQGTRVEMEAEVD